MASAALTSSFPPRRGKARLRVGIPAHLISVHGRSRVTLLDLSESGARVRYEGEPMKDFVLEWLGYEAFGAVVRRNGRELGLRFDEPIGEACVLGTRDRMPAVAMTEDQATRFAREWARGRDRAREREPMTSRRGLMPRRNWGSNDSSRQPVEPSAPGGWLGTAGPFLLGAVILGVAAGYASVFY